MCEERNRWWINAYSEGATNACVRHVTGQLSVTVCALLTGVLSARCWSCWYIICGFCENMGKEFSLSHLAGASGGRLISPLKSHPR